MNQEPAKLVDTFLRRGIVLAVEHGDLVTRSDKPIPPAVALTLEYAKPHLVRYLNANQASPSSTAPASLPETPTTPAFPALPDWLEPGDVLESVDHVFIFPVGQPIGNDLMAYLRDVVLPHMAGLSERPPRELAYEAAVLELAATYPEAAGAAHYKRLRETFENGFSATSASPPQLAQHTLATHGYAADNRRHPYAEWLSAARVALTTYRAPGKTAR